MKRVGMCFLVILIFLSSVCVAASEDTSRHSLSNYLFAKLMSENYVLLLNDITYDKSNNKEIEGNIKNPKFVTAKFKYQVAYIKFRVFHDMYTFMMDEKGRIYKEDEEKLAVLGNDALNAYLDFSKSADDALAALSGNAGYSSNEYQHFVKDNITMQEMLKFTFANVFLTPNGTTIESDKIKRILSQYSDPAIIAELITASYNKYVNLRKTKYGKLTAWLDSCAWDSWDTIIARARSVSKNSCAVTVGG